MQPQLDSPANITFVGHATTVVELSGTRILTDPVFRHRFRLLKRRPELREVDLNGIDAVALSHMHFDHMDYPSLRMVPKHVPIIAPEGAGKYLHRKIKHDIVELRVGQSVRVGNIDVHATPAKHESNAYWPLWYSKDVLSFCFVAAQTVFFAGDTALFDGMRDLGKSFDIDTALLPVWGYGPYLRGDHMAPAEAAEALGLLDARVAVPIHWGTLHPVGPWWKNMSYLWQPPREFQLEATRHAPHAEVRILEPGDHTAVHPHVVEEAAEEFAFAPFTPAPILV